MKSDSDGGGSRTGSGRAVEARPEPFAVEVQSRDDVALVQPRGELDLATADKLRAVLDRIESPARVVFDLRGLTFIDSSGLHLLVAFHERAQRDGFQLTILAPAPPVDRTIWLCGLGEVLPFAAAIDVADSEPRDSSPAERGTGH